MKLHFLVWCIEFETIENVFICVRTVTECIIENNEFNYMWL